jgi:hypothetical protein
MTGADEAAARLAAEAPAAEEEPRPDDEAILRHHDEAAQEALETAIRVRQVIDTRPPLIRSLAEVLELFERRRAARLPPPDPNGP